MTCIIGIEHKDGVLLAADTLASGGWDSTDRSDPKLYEIHPGIAVGFTTSYRMGQLLGYSLDLRSVVGPVDRHPDTVHRWMVTVFVEQARNALKAGGFSKTDNGVETGGSFLVAAHGRLFHVQDDWQVAVPKDGRDATGCGHAYALGAMTAAHVYVRGPEEIARAGMAAAMKHSNGVGGSVQLMQVSA